MLLILKEWSDDFICLSSSQFQCTWSSFEGYGLMGAQSKFLMIKVMSLLWLACVCMLLVYTVYDAKIYEIDDLVSWK